MRFLCLLLFFIFLFILFFFGGGGGGSNLFRDFREIPFGHTVSHSFPNNLNLTIKPRLLKNN